MHERRRVISTIVTPYWQLAGCELKLKHVLGKSVWAVRRRQITHFLRGSDRNISYRAAGETMRIWFRLAMITFSLSAAAVMVLLITSRSTPIKFITEYIVVDELNIYLVGLRDPLRDMYVNLSHRSCLKRPFVGLEWLRLRQRYDRTVMNIRRFQISQNLSFETMEQLRCST